MSDHEMQFFPEAGSEQEAPAREIWSSELPSVPPEPLPVYALFEERSDRQLHAAPGEKSDRQSVERVWSRLEEHVSRNREFYRYNRNVPVLQMQSSPDYAPYAKAHERSGRFLRGFPWRRLDMVAALLFLTVLMGSLLTAVYNVRLHTAAGFGAGETVPADQALCKGVLAPRQQVMLVEGPDGLRVQPPTVMIRQGGQLTWVNQTNSTQVVVNASTKIAAMKVALHTRGQGQPLLKANTYTYEVRSVANPSAQPGASIGTKSAQVVVEVLNIVVIAPDKNNIGGVFEPSTMKIPQDSDLVWLNITQQQQIVLNTIRKQEAPRILSPNSCLLQRNIQQGSYNYTLQGSDSRLSLFAG